MSQYHAQQCFHACPLPVTPQNQNGNISIQIRTEKGKTNWMNITPEVFKKIEELLTEMD